MRMALIVIGILLLVAGVWVLAGDASYRTTETIIKVGEAELNATTEKAIPDWAGIAGIAVGGLLLLGGIFRKR